MSKRSSRPPSPEPRRADSKQIVDAILQAGRELAIQGVDHVSANSIAKRAGVGVASLYRYFPDKHAVFAEIFRRQHVTYLEQVQAALDPTRTLEDGVRKCLEILLKVPPDEYQVRRAFNLELPLSWSENELCDVLDKTQEMMTVWAMHQCPGVDAEQMRYRVFYGLGIARGMAMMCFLRPDSAPPTGSMLDDLTKVISVATRG